MTEAEQLLLWRWSTIVQLTSLAMATAFFALLARDSRRAELRTWARAWFANFIALAVTSTYWTWQPGWFPLVAGLYLASKLVFVLLLVDGGWMMMRRVRLLTTRQITILAGAYAVFGAIVCRDLFSLGVLHHVVMGATLLVLAAVLARNASEPVLWLAGGIALRGFLAATEAGAYILQKWPPRSGLMQGLAEPAGMFLSTSSAFDTASEWLIVLGCLLAVSDRQRRELLDANRDLLLAQIDLRRLADRDPLTALVNRRSLPEIFRTVQPNGALLLFFDLDGFKRINDQHGHAAGDTCLKLFATSLRESFRPDDHVIRYGGDEFLVVASGLDTASARGRVDEVRRRMQRTPGSAFACRFSVGMAELAPGGQPEAALEAADAQMYKAKQRAIT